MARIISLLPSATEIVCALGLTDHLVGRSHECDYPPEVGHLPVLTAPKFAPEGSSAEIDRRVKSILQNALSVYRVDAERLTELKPDAIVTQAQCQVCAVSERDLEDALAHWMGGSRPALVSLTAASLDGVFADIERVASVLGVGQAARNVTAAMKQRIDAVAERAASASSRPRVATIEWADPLMAGGNWMPELVAIAGGQNLFGEAGEHSPWIQFEQLKAADPEAIVVSPCGFGIERSLQELAGLTRNPLWPTLSAVKQGHVFVADGSQYFNRPGPRIVDSLEMMAEMLHPELFSFGYEGRAWRRC